MAKYPALDLRFTPGPGAGTLQDFLYAELDTFEPVAIHEHDAGDAWRVFFRTAAQRDGALGALRSEFGGALLDITPLSVDDEDWARRSQESLKAIRAGRLVIAPPWDVPAVGDADRLVVIEPSMGFGTGHHATTRLCLELLQEVGVKGRTVLDVGTGSGVLAIAAMTLGAAQAIALDNDPDALQNARDNVERNGVTVDVREVDLAALAPGIEAEVVLANLTGAVLQRFASALRGSVTPGGVLIVSGFGPDEADQVAAAFGLRAATSRTDGDWTALILPLL